MTVNVVLFARVRELAGTDRQQMLLEEGATLGCAKAALLDRYPALTDLLPHCNFAVNHEYSDDDTPLAEGCEIGCIPPVSGG